MAGVLSTLNRIFERAEIKRLASTTILEAHVPVYTECPTCGYDPDTSSGLDLSCPTCHGYGRTASDTVAILHCRVSWIDMAKFNTWQGVPSGEMGDCSIQTSIEHEALMNTVQRVEGAHLLLDGRALKPVSITRNRIEGLTSLDVRCVVTRKEQHEES